MPLGGFAPMPLRLGGTSEQGWTAVQHARFAADLVAVKRTAPFAVFTFVKSGASITIESYRGMNGVGSAYAPTGADGGTGIATFSWSTPGFEDPYEVQYGLRLRHGRATAHGSSYRRSLVTITGPAAFTITTRDSGATVQDCRVTVKLW